MTPILKGLLLRQSVHISMNWYKIATVNIGYRGGQGGVIGTEGNGIYVAKNKELAEWFGPPIFEVTYNEPSKPLVVNEEPLPLLDERFDIFAPISPQDSFWIQLNKQAVINTKLTQQKWNDKTAADELTRLLKENGFDAVRVISGRRSWDVLLNPSLIVSQRQIE